MKSVMRGAGALMSRQRLDNKPGTRIIKANET